MLPMWAHQNIFHFPEWILFQVRALLQNTSSPMQATRAHQSELARPPLHHRRRRSGKRQVSAALALVFAIIFSVFGVCGTHSTSTANGSSTNRSGGNNTPRRTEQGVGIGNGHSQVTGHTRSLVFRCALNLRSPVCGFQQRFFCKRIPNHAVAEHWTIGYFCSAST